MKIEIGESLVYSYLRHEKGCLVSQTNWKPSGCWSVNQEIHTAIKEEFDSINGHHAFSQLFKSSFEQTIKQAEVDVLGIDAEGKVYAFEVAFHENGLQYGSKEETRKRVLKKLLRGYLVLKYYFPNHPIELSFCSPKVNHATEAHIKEFFEILNSEFSSPKINFSYISNQNFSSEILEKTIAKTTNEADSSELFARSIKLFNLFKKTHEEKPAPFTTREEKQKEPELKEQLDDHEKNEYIIIKNTEIPLNKDFGETVQDYVKRIMHLLLDRQILPEDEIERLKEKNYSHKTFSLAFPLLRDIHEGYKDSAGHSRYWSRDVFGGKYYVCSQWWKDHEKKYLIKIKQWLLYLV